MTNSSLYVSELYSRLVSFFFFFFNDTATTEIYTLSLHDALPIYSGDVHVDDELGIRLVDVGGGLPLGRGDEADGTAVRHLVEIDLQLLGEVDGEAARPPGGPAAGA